MKSQLCCQYDPARTSLSFSSVIYIYGAPGCLMLSSGLGDDQKSHWQAGRQAGRQASFQISCASNFSRVIQ